MAVKLSGVQALSWIVGSSIVFSIGAHKGIKYWFSQKKEAATPNVVEYIVQTGPCKEALDSEYLIEVLDLSVDKPALFKTFDTKAAEDKLYADSLIEQVAVKKIKPNMVYIDYTLRKPIAKASDFYNAALDKEGVLFPIHPFFSPKKLPEIYLGEIGRAHV